MQVNDTDTPAITDDEGQEINTNIFNVNDHMDHIARIRAEGFNVDDGNLALPKKVLCLKLPQLKSIKMASIEAKHGSGWHRQPGHIAKLILPHIHCYICKTNRVQPV